MKSVIDDLYFGRINPCDRCSTPEEQELMGYIDECYEKLSEGMTEEQRMGLENLKDSLMEVGLISEREMFAYGVRLGMRLAVEVYNTMSVIK
ncbi:MAG: hypothetical protein IJW77_00265 [Clostridia bacterium]|nr:hypothetical protein [Clostridia bacterium]